MSKHPSVRASFVPHLLSFILLFSACAPTSQAAPSPTLSLSEMPGTQETVVAQDAPIATSAPVSTIAVNAEALRGVTVTVWHPWYGPEASLFESQVAEFNSTNEWGITVLTAGQNNFTELYENVTSSLAAPDKPQLVVGLPEHALYWDSQGGVADWNTYVTDPQWGWSADEIADFSPAFWKQDEVNGKRVGLPAQRTARFLFYNQSWAHELGFNSPPATPEDFRKQACAANKALLSNQDSKDDGYGGWLVDSDPMTALSWLLAFDGGVMDGSGYRFLRPENVEAFRFLKTMFDDRCAWIATSTEPFDAFAARQALFITGSLEDLAAQTRALNTVASTDQWEILPFPGAKQDAFVVYGSSYIMLPSSQEQQLATWLFVRWMLSTEVQARWVETTGMYPLRLSTMTQVAGYASTHPQWVAAVKLLPEADLPPQLASWRLIRAALGDGFGFMFRVNMPVGQVPVILGDLDRAVQDLAD